MTTLWADCETGGTDPKYSDLLQAAFVLTNGRNVEIGRLSLKLKPETGIYRVSAGALNVNKIDLQVHDKEAITYTEGAARLRDFLAKYRVSEGKRFTVGGWNPSFDVGYVTEFLIPKVEWLKSCRYGLFDMQSVVVFLVRMGVLPEEYASLHMHEVAQAMGVDIDWDAPHDALQDVLATVGIYESLEGMFKGAMDAAPA